MGTVLAGVPAYAHPDDSQVIRWQRFRQTFGLRADAEFAEWIGRRASLGAPEVSLDYGTPLTAVEAASLRERSTRTTAQAAATRSYFRGQPDSLHGGTYIDNRAGGRLVVQVTSDVQRVRAELGRAVPHADMISVAEVRHSYAALRRIQDVVAREYRSRGVDVVSTSLQVRENLVVLRVRSDLDAAVAATRADFPLGAVRVEQGEYVNLHGTRVKNSPPFRGGQAIGDGGDWRCTLGFIGHDGASQYFAITSGHCGPVGSAWYQPCCAGVNPGIGVVDFNPYRSGPSLTDSARIPIIQTRKSNQITRTMPGGGIYYYAITSSQAQGADTVGDVDCNGGAATNWDCGEITATSYDYYDYRVDRTFTYARRASNVGGFGDSGGPHFHVPVAHGIHVGNDPQHNYESIYSHIYDVLDDLYLADVYAG